MGVEGVDKAGTDLGEKSDLAQVFGGEGGG